jgi:putative intracellular protease/amidase
MESTDATHPSPRRAEAGPAGPLLLYSTSPSPHERLALDWASRRRGRDPQAPLRVVVLLTPLAAPEPRELRGLRRHFGTQGVAITLEDAGLATREDASRSEVCARLAAADLVLISGGSSSRLVEATLGTPALAALEAARAAGAVVAGCSAGAIAPGAGFFRGPRDDRRPAPSWGWLPRALVAPHFGRYDLPPWTEAFPGCCLLGIPNAGMAFVAPDGGGATRIESLGPAPLTILAAGDAPPLALPPGRSWQLAP